MRFPAAASSSGMLTKLHIACVIIVSTSGRPSEPPRVVIVPWPLMTVVTPSSSYTLPVEPRPDAIRLQSGCGVATVPFAGAAESFRDPASDANAAPSVPRNDRRFHESLNLNVSAIFMLLECRSSTAISVARFERLLLHDGSGAVNFNERAARQRRDCDGGSRRTAIREILRKYFVHAVVVVDLREINSELQDAVHRAAARLDEILHVVHHFRGVQRDVHVKRARIVRVRALAGDVDHAVEDHERSDEAFAVGGLAVVAEFGDAGCGGLRCGRGYGCCGGYAARKECRDTESREKRSERRSEIPA